MDENLNFENFKEEALKNSNIKKEYNELHEEFEFIDQLISARKHANLTQTQIAKLMNTKQPAIARLECGGFEHINLSTLKKYASAIGFKIKIQFKQQI